MRHRLAGSILVAAAAVGFSPMMFAQTAARPAAARKAAAAGPRDLAGVWVRARGYGRAFNPKEEPPMQPWAAERFRAAREGITDPAQQGRDELDPVIARCDPVGMPRIMLFPRAFEIIPIPGRLLMYFEWDHTVRQIYINGKKEEDPDPIWLGYSTGRWDHDTLVVDTVGLTDQTWLDSVGHPHSDKLHVVERIRRTGVNTMEIGFTFDDPGAYTKPWTGKIAYQRQPGWQIIEHFACENRELYGDALLKKGSEK
jgi:hypothetical protein